MSGWAPDGTATSRPGIAPPAWVAPGAPPSASPGEEDRLVRSYLVTGGRTDPGGDGGDLPLEALVLLTAAGHLARDLRFERATIAALCQEALSVTEVAARTGLPLGVTRVLVGDMCAEGLLEVTVPVGSAARPGAALLESVLDGLRGG